MMIRIQILLLVALYVGPIVWFVLKQPSNSISQRLWLAVIVGVPFAGAFAFVVWKVFLYSRRRSAG